MAVDVGLVKRLYREFGLASVVATGPDAWLIIFSRSSRMLAYGANSVFIALLFSALEFSDFRIGLFMTLTLVGDVLLTLALTLVADRLGRRRTLLLGAGLMVGSGIAFMLSNNYWVLLLAAIIGVVSATGGDFGPFRAIEESILSQLTVAEARTSVLAWYVTLSSVGSAIGTESSGRIIVSLKSREGWTDVDAYHAMFSAYVIFGLLNMGAIALLSQRTEPERELGDQAVEEEVLLQPVDREGQEDDAAATTAVVAEVEKSSDRTSWLAQLSAGTRSVMFKLWPLLIVDSLADGMVGYSLTTFYLHRRFDVAQSTIGDITSVSYILAAVSTVFAGPLANRLGLVNTMVFTHVPSSAAVLLFPGSPNLIIAIIFFFFRTGLNNMDQAPRTAFIAAAVPANERTAVNGITSTLRTLAATGGPTVTGLLASHDRFWIAFVAAGFLRLAYDFGLWALFINMDLNH